MYLSRYVACIETFTTKLMEVSGLWNLNKKKVETLLVRNIVAPDALPGSARIYLKI